MMSDVNLTKVTAAKGAKKRLVGAIYKRTRLDESGCRAFTVLTRLMMLLAACVRQPGGRAVSLFLWSKAEMFVPD